ncbi:MAG: protein of unknown function transrane [Actinomycetia bacterium]|nr:protein of unknown function transrane [Actinomycetes bacterium]
MEDAYGRLMTISSAERARPSSLGPAPRHPASRARSRRGAVLCLLSATAFGMAAIFAKESYRAGVSVPSMLTVRFAFAAAVFWVVVAFRRPALPSRGVLMVCVILGAGGYALQSGFYFAALAKIDASLVALLLYAYPALVTVLAMVLRRESPDRRRVAALICSGSGLLLILGTAASGGDIAPAGVLLALGAAGAYAVYLTVADGLPVDLDLYLLSAVVCTAAAVSLGSYGLTTGSLDLAVRPQAWLWMGLLALVSTVIAVACMFAGVRQIGAPSAAILSSAEPAVTVVSTALVYGERLTLGQAAGGAAVIAAVVILQLRRSQPGRTRFPVGQTPPPP